MGEIPAVGRGGGGTGDHPMKAMHLLQFEDDARDPSVYRLMQRGNNPPQRFAVVCWHRPAVCCSARCAALGLDTTGKHEIVICKAGPGSRPIEIGMLDLDNQSGDVRNSLDWVRTLTEGGGS